MGLINRFKHYAATRAISLLSRGIRNIGGGETFYPIGFGKSIGDLDLSTAFLVPEVNAILNKRASAHSSMKLEVVNKNTMEPVDNNLSRLLKNPNWFQAQSEYIKQTNLFHDIYGNEFNYLFFGVGVKPENAKAMYSLMPDRMKVKYKSDESYFMQVEEPDVNYEYDFNNKRIDIPSDQIIHLNDNRINAKNKDDLLIGQSKLTALSKPVLNIVAAYEARGIMIRNRGALGILSNDSKDGIGSTLPIDDKEKENLQKEYRNYGITDNQWQIIITSLSLKWQPMGVDVDKLKLFEEVTEDTIKICDSYNFPYELLGSQKGVTYANKREAEKGWYQDSIIPEAQERIDAFNQKFQTAGKPYTITGKFDHLPIFQDDRKEMISSFVLVTNALSKALMDGAITLEQYQSELRRHGFIEEL